MIRGLDRLDLPVISSACLLACGVCSALAQEAPQPEELPSLDALLGLAEQGEQGSRTDLERQLTQQQVTELFDQAIMLMGDTADRLTDERDTGLITQRLQGDVISKLDMLIQEAKKQQQQQQSSSSSSSSSQSQQQQQPNQAQQQNQRNESPSADSSPEAMSPDGRDPEMRASVQAARAMWGSLPTKVRDALTQGSSDRFSSLYESMTEAYYQRLAEDAQK